MSHWPSVAIGAPSTSADAHPLDGQGNPAYRRHAPIPGVYRLDAAYRGETDSVSHSSLELFDARTPWLKAGLGSRLFPVWSARAFYEACGPSLYRSLLRQWYTHKARFPRARREGAEDLWTDVQLYFLERTEREQRDYHPMVDQWGSFCHYPLTDSYEDGDQIFLGILSLYHERIRELFKTMRPDDSLSLDALEEVHGGLAGADNEALGLIDLAEGLERGLREVRGMDESALRDFFLYLAREGTLASRLKTLGKGTRLTVALIRKAEHHLATRILPALLAGTSWAGMEEGLGDAKRRRNELLRRIAASWLSRGERGGEPA
ncbi:MAG: hypothetical protein J0L75_08490 [Spirochaetes bacterium]|nr:hypothetical protein [Spirochaetota bacterium]